MNIFRLINNHTVNELTAYDHVQTIRIRFNPKRKEDILLVKNDVIQQTNQ